VDTEQKKNAIENFKQFYAGNGSILFQEPGYDGTNQKRFYSII